MKKKNKGARCERPCSFINYGVRGLPVLDAAAAVPDGVQEQGAVVAPDAAVARVAVVVSDAVAAWDAVEARDAAEAPVVAAASGAVERQGEAAVHYAGALASGYCQEPVAAERVGRRG